MHTLPPGLWQPLKFSEYLNVHESYTQPNLFFFFLLLFNIITSMFINHDAAKIEISGSEEKEISDMPRKGKDCISLYA